MFGTLNIQATVPARDPRLRGRGTTDMLPTFVIGLREGVEAALIVGIIAAFLIQRGERKAIRSMWLGVAIAIALCLGVAIVLSIIGENLPFKQREIMEGVLALIAVAGVTYMIVWMRRHSRGLKGVLEENAAAALVAGSSIALIGMAFFAVIREGLETAIFMLAAFQNSTNPMATGLGAVIGVVVAVGLGYAIYKGGVRINLSRFFRITGFVLVLVAAGLLASAVHSLSEAEVVTQLQSSAFDLTWLVDPGSVRAALLTGMLGLQQVPTVAEVLAWLLYAVPMGAYVLWPQRAGRRAEPVAAATTTTTTTTA
jgi:high-affinity iron transporter